MGNCRYAACVLLCVTATCSAAVQFQSCESGIVEVVDGIDNFNLTCIQYSGRVIWVYSGASRSWQVNVGTCDSSACQMDDLVPPGYFSLTYLSTSSSRLTNAATGREDGANYIYTCHEVGRNAAAMCQVNVVSHAVVPASGLTFTQTSGWTIRGEATIASVFSSLGRYKCEWTEISSTGEQKAVPAVTLSLTPDAQDTSNTQNRSGNCTFSKPLPRNDGTYTYKVVISPGNTTQTGGSEQIVRPATPTITCSPSPYVPENTNVSCTCGTQNLGKPEGRLTWYTGRGSKTVINSGDVGDTRLEMTPQRLTLSDHGITEFRCDVHWIENIEGESYTASVGYGPSGVQMTLSSSTVGENQEVSFQCQADGRPTPSIMLVNKNSNQTLRSQLSPLYNTIPRARCQDASVYECRAGNGMGADQSNNTTLLVQCTPRGVSGNSTLVQLPSLSFKGDPVFQDLITVAHPAPSSYMLTYLGQQSSLTSPGVSLKNIDMKVLCQQDPGSLYTSSCAILVRNVTSTATGFYKLTVMNDLGVGEFVFQVEIQEIEESQSSTTQAADYVGLSIGLGTALVLLMVTAILFVLWLWRRGWALPCAESAAQRTTVTTKDKTIECLNPLDAVVRGPYDSLQMQEVGIRSPYAEIGHQDNRHNTNADPETIQAAGPYDSLQMHDVGVRAPYAEIGFHGNQSDTDTISGNPQQRGVLNENVLPAEEPAYENNQHRRLT